MNCAPIHECIWSVNKCSLEGNFGIFFNEKFTFKFGESEPAETSKEKMRKIIHFPVGFALLFIEKIKLINITS
jgi:hypothetical protein